MNYAPMLVGLIVGVVLCTISACLASYHEEKLFDAKRDSLIKFIRNELDWAVDKKNEYREDRDMENMFHGLIRGYETTLKVLYNASNKTKNKKD